MSKPGEEKMWPIAYFGPILPILGWLFGFFIRNGLSKKGEPENAFGLMICFIILSSLVGMVLSIIGLYQKQKIGYLGIGLCVFPPFLLFFMR